ncbi:hypothetical protein [Streptomyces flaveolus]|uniref:hypothetical protein n=1 Tax=Streptomyces flaveolus TaxID=67297 RepID=UPI00381D8BB4
MNFQTPLSALFPGTSGRLLTALVGHHIAQADRPLSLDELSKSAAVTSTQLEAALFRLGLLGLIAPRGKGEAVHLLASHIAWGALRQMVDLRDAVIDMVRREAQTRLRPAPNYLALTGAVIEGTATHPADVWELIVVPPPTAQADWHDDVAALTSHLSRALGNVVVYRIAQEIDEADARGGTHAVRVFLP